MTLVSTVSSCTHQHPPTLPLVGLDKIEQLQQHPNEQIYELAVKVITNYFPTDSEEESERD